MELTFPQYIDSPSGNKNMVWNHKNMYRELYSKKLGEILVREVGKIKYDLYYSNNTYYIHLKIPSEKIPKFYYDTVVMFYSKDKLVLNSNNLKKYNIKFYSNDPSFVFTFAYSFLKNDLFIRDLIPRMSKEAVKKAAKETNPKNEVGYVKSIYFSYLWMDKEGLFDAFKYRNYGLKYDKIKLLKNIMIADKKIQDRQDADEDIRKKKKIEKKKQKSNKSIKEKIIQKTSTQINNNFNHTKVISTNKVKTIGNVKKATNKFKKF